MSPTTLPAVEKPLLLSVPEAAHLLNVCDRTVWSMVYDKQLSTVRLGRRVLIPRANIEEIVGSAS